MRGDGARKENKSANTGSLENKGEKRVRCSHVRKSSKILRGMDQDKRTTQARASWSSGSLIDEARRRAKIQRHLSSKRIDTRKKGEIPKRSSRYRTQGDLAYDLG